MTVVLDKEGIAKHYLREFKMHDPDRCEIKDDKVKLFGHILALIDWDENEFPTFTFLGENTQYLSHMQNEYRVKRTQKIKH